MAAADFGQGADTLTTGAKMVSAAKIDLDQTASQLQGQLNALEAQWQGQGGRAFDKMFKAWHEQQQKIVRTLDEFESSLTSTDKINVNADMEQSANMNMIAGKLGGAS